MGRKTQEKPQNHDPYNSRSSSRDILQKEKLTYNDERKRRLLFQFFSRVRRRDFNVDDEREKFGGKFVGTKLVISTKIT
jgi:hypothetical protein